MGFLKSSMREAGGRWVIFRQSSGFFMKTFLWERLLDGGSYFHKTRGVFYKIVWPLVADLCHPWMIKWSIFSVLMWMASLAWSATRFQSHKRLGGLAMAMPVGCFGSVTAPSNFQDDAGWCNALACFQKSQLMMRQISPCLLYDFCTI